ncbi:DUF4259 domain-containing protein [Ectobacillus antri]|jgi:hypothetical protein|uniref:DUF4259 domain-containing protein n=1 Tax=Ectobacillus antri TaxID=2486280 RepID=A0ABT6H3C1_9BACI|nr:MULTISPECIES: DUF4259 domain-containing protein [Ectobacillus]MDG4655456.1 DUF4259 domain-containing protein [Ectobacillus antri]MDG5753214.1 DUF4259 domain-containing protein [Ectobacillus antri]UOY94081.1 DUF4259 domain-containing protein [Ectobacillus sp. JY-23]
MGAWGTGIFDNDTTCDVRDDFFEFLEEGLSVQEATQQVLDTHLEEFEEEDLEVISWVYTGLAAAQLEKNVLQEEIRVKAIDLINQGADLELWAESGEDEDYEERKKVLSELRSKLEATNT